MRRMVSELLVPSLPIQESWSPRDLTALWAHKLVPSSLSEVGGRRDGKGGGVLSKQRPWRTAQGWRQLQRLWFYCKLLCPLEAGMVWLPSSTLWRLTLNSPKQVKEQVQRQTEGWLDSWIQTVQPLPKNGLCTSICCSDLGGGRENWRQHCLGSKVIPTPAHSSPSHSLTSHHWWSERGCSVPRTAQNFLAHPVIPSTCHLSWMRPWVHSESQLPGPLSLSWLLLMAQNFLQKRLGAGGVA